MGTRGTCDFHVYFLGFLSDFRWFSAHFGPVSRTSGADFVEKWGKAEVSGRSVEEVVSDLWLKPIGDMSSIYDELYAMDS